MFASKPPNPLKGGFSGMKDLNAEEMKKTEGLNDYNNEEIENLQSLLFITSKAFGGRTNAPIRTNYSIGVKCG